MQDVIEKIKKLLCSNKASFDSSWKFIIIGMVGLLLSVLIGAYIVIPILQNVTTTGSYSEKGLNTTTDAWYSLVYDDLISLSAINSSTGDTLIEGTDFKVDYTGGRINVTFDDDPSLGINTTYSYYPDSYVKGTAGTIISNVPTMVALGIFILSVLLIGVGGWNIYQERN